MDHRTRTGWIDGVATTAPVLGLLLALTAGPASAQDGQSREEIWYAPTAEDWAKPCLITWQRTWDDAVALALRTGRPLMIAVKPGSFSASSRRRFSLPVPRLLLPSIPVCPTRRRAASMA